MIARIREELEVIIGGKRAVQFSFKIDSLEQLLAFLLLELDCAERCIVYIQVGIIHSIRKDDFLITEDELRPVNLILEQCAVPVIDPIDIELGVDKPVKIRCFRHLRTLRLFNGLFNRLFDRFFSYRRNFRRLFNDFSRCLRCFRLFDRLRLLDFLHHRLFYNLMLLLILEATCVEEQYTEHSYDKEESYGCDEPEPISHHEGLSTN